MKAELKIIRGILERHSAIIVTDKGTSDAREAVERALASALSVPADVEGLVGQINDQLYETFLRNDGAFRARCKLCNREAFDESGVEHSDGCVVKDLTSALSTTPTDDVLDAYDAGLLGDYGGGNVEWWQDYIRSELGRAHEFYQSQVSASSAPAMTLLAEARTKLIGFTAIITAGKSKEMAQQVVGEFNDLCARIDQELSKKYETKLADKPEKTDIVGLLLAIAVMLSRPISDANRIHFANRCFDECNRLVPGFGVEERAALMGDKPSS